MIITFTHLGILHYCACIYFLTSCSKNSATLLTTVWISWQRNVGDVLYKTRPEYVTLTHFSPPKWNTEIRRWMEKLCYLIKVGVIVSGSLSFPLLLLLSSLSPVINMWAPDGECKGDDCSGFTRRGPNESDNLLKPKCFAVTISRAATIYLWITSSRGISIRPCGKQLCTEEILDKLQVFIIFRQ